MQRQSNSYVIFPPVKEHVSIDDKSLCKNMASAFGGCKNMHPPSCGHKRKRSYKTIRNVSRRKHTTSIDAIEQTKIESRIKQARTSFIPDPKFRLKVTLCEVVRTCVVSLI